MQNNLGLVKTKENANSAACLQFLICYLAKANILPFYLRFYRLYLSTQFANRAILKNQWYIALKKQ